MSWPTREEALAGLRAVVGKAGEPGWNQGVDCAVAYLEDLQRQDEALLLHLDAVAAYWDREAERVGGAGYVPMKNRADGIREAAGLLRGARQARQPPPLGYQGELHVYGPLWEHDDAWIVGTEPALVVLRGAVDKAIRSGRAGACLSCTIDGEGFGLVVVRVEPEKMQTLRLPYSDENARDHGDTGRSFPQLPGEEYRALLEEAGHEPSDRPPGEGGAE